MFENQKYIFNLKISLKYIAMAEGGGDFGYVDPDLDDAIDNDDIRDDESISVPSEEEQEVDTTRPFLPGAASTPHNGGE